MEKEISKIHHVKKTIARTITEAIEFVATHSLMEIVEAVKAAGEMLLCVDEIKRGTSTLHHLIRPPTAGNTEQLNFHNCKKRTFKNKTDAKIASVKLFRFSISTVLQNNSFTPGTIRNSILIKVEPLAALAVAAD